MINKKAATYTMLVMMVVTLLVYLLFVKPIIVSIFVSGLLTAYATRLVYSIIKDEIEK